MRNPAAAGLIMVGIVRKDKKKKQIRISRVDSAASAE
jgi:hypothetical protein